MKQFKSHRNSLNWIIILLCFSFSCKQSQHDNQTSSAVEKTSPAIDQSGFSQAQPKSTDISQDFDQHVFCFAQKTAAINHPNEYNYEFIKLEKNSSGNVTGSFYISYFGKDEAKGHLKGIWNETTQAFEVTAIYWAEGEVYEEQRTYPLANNTILLGYKTTDGQDATLPRIHCDAYESLFKAYNQGYLNHFLNTTDRSRMKKVMASQNLGYSNEELEKLKFMEAMVDLDRDPSEFEYLLYIMDPMICGTGGCTLFITNKSGDILSKISVTRPPIYIPLTSFENDQKLKGEWKALYVYSKGYRRLTHKNGHYSTNASMAPEIEEAQLLNFPNEYRLVMDYLD